MSCKKVWGHGTTNLESMQGWQCLFLIVHVPLSGQGIHAYVYAQGGLHAFDDSRKRD